MERTEIMGPETVRRKIVRMAWEIVEDHHPEKKLWLVGIASRGLEIAKLLEKQLKAIHPIEVETIELSVQKANPWKAPIHTQLDREDLSDSTVIIVDDVLNSGRTLCYAICHFMQRPVRQIHSAVLVNRSHAQFPVRATYVGTHLSTTLQEHVEVDPEALRVYLQ